MIQLLKSKTKHLPSIATIILVCLFIPYCGTLGSNIFSRLGKNYYIIVGAICFAYVIYKVSFLLLFKNKKIALISIFLLLLLFSILLINTGFKDNFLFGVLLITFFLFSFVAIDKGQLLNMGKISMFMLVLFFAISVIKRITYFNPNSYAFISTELYLWSLYYVSTRKKSTRIFLFLILSAIAIALTYIIYNSATQVICVIFFAMLYLMRKTRLIKRKGTFIIMISTVFLFTVCLPFIVYFLIGKGVLDYTFFTNRGERWTLAINAIKKVGLFRVYSEAIGAHNGFLELALNYTFVFAVIYMLIMFFVILSCYKIYKKDRQARIVVFIITTFVLMNCSESFFIGLTDSYFIIMPLASLVALYIKKRRIRKISAYITNNDSSVQLETNSLAREVAYNIEPSVESKPTIINETSSKELPVEEVKTNNSSLTKNAIYKIILNICNIIIPIIVGPYVLRVLDRSYYDLFNSLNASFAVLLVIGGFGIYTYGVREISRVRSDKEKVNKLFSELFFIGIITNMLVMTGYIIASLFLQDTDLKKYLCLILSIQFLGNVFNVEWINEANENYRFIALKSIAVRIVYLVCIFIFVRHADDIIAYVLLMMCSTFFNTFASYIYISKNNKLTIKGLNFKKHLIPLFIIFVISNISILYAQSDKVMLDYFDSSKSVTSYQLAQYISSLIYSLLIPLVAVALPRLSKLFVEEKEKCFELHNRVFNYFFMLATPALVGAALLSSEIIMLYGGNQYLDCIVPLSIYCIAQFISAGCYIFGEGLMYVTGNEKRLLINNFIGGISNIVLNFIFIACGIFNTNLAIVSIVFAYGLATVLDYLFIRKNMYKIKIINRQTLLYFVGSALFVPIVFLIKHFALHIFLTIGLSMLICVLLYFILLLVFKDPNFKMMCEKVNIKIKNIFKKGS